MKIIGVGIDIVSIERIKKVKNFSRFAEYILNKVEFDNMNKSRDKAEFLASRFASKEALIKAYPEEINYQEIETFKDGEKFMQKVNKIGVKMYNISASISHSFDSAIAISTVSEE